MPAIGFGWWGWGRAEIGRKAEPIDGGEQGFFFADQNIELGVLCLQLLGFFLDELGLFLDLLDFSLDERVFPLVFPLELLVFYLCFPDLVLDPLSLLPLLQDRDLDLSRALLDLAHGSPIEHR